MAYRVRVNWSGAAITGPGLSTFYFDSGVGTAANAVTAVATFLGAVDNSIANTAIWGTETDVATIDGTGQITAITNVGAQTGAGSEAGDRLSPATQGLVALRTGSIIDGREVQGRIFLPGMVESHNGSTGTPDSGIIGAVNTAAAALIADVNTTWVVWSRVNEVFVPITTATMNNKWAVLRSRRD